MSSGLGLFRESRNEEANRLANISGRVLAKSAQLLSGAIACAFPADLEVERSGSESVCEPPDASGHYVLHRLPPRDYQVSVSADGCRPRIANKGEPVHLREKDVVLPDIELDEGGARVSGIVLDATGGPVVGASVQASFASDDLPFGREALTVTKSDEAGEFALSVAAGRLSVSARHDGYATARVPSYAPATGVRLVIVPSSSISGTVIAQSDQSPVAGVRVVARSDSFEQSTISDTSGAFKLAGLRAGVYSLDARGGGWIGRRSGSVAVDFGDATKSVVVPVTRGVRVTGSIRVGEEPCRAGQVYLASASLPMLTERADYSGRVVFDGVPAETYQSAALCDGYGRSPGPPLQVARADVTDLTWTFEHGATVTVRARTPDGMPVPRAWIHLAPVQLESRSGPDSARPINAPADGEGVVRFFDRAEGRYTISGLGLEDSSKVDLVVGKDPVESVLTLKSLGTIRVLVKDKKGHGNDQLTVIVAAQDTGRRGAVAELRGGGRYEIGSLAPGRYSVELHDGTNATFLADGPTGGTEVRPGEVSVVEAVYGGFSGRIEGRVVDGARIPAQNVWVEARPVQGESRDFLSSMRLPVGSGERPILTDAEGRFAIEGLVETATFEVVASHPMRGEARIDRVAVGENVELTLSAPGSLGGVVLDSRGRPPAYFQISVRSKGGLQQLNPQFGPDAQGQWFVDHVNPGTIEIQAQGADGVASIERELGPAQRLGQIELRLQPRSITPN
jgi:hypothetical protein